MSEWMHFSSTWENKRNNAAGNRFICQAYFLYEIPHVSLSSQQTVTTAQFSTTELVRKKVLWEAHLPLQHFIHSQHNSIAHISKKNAFIIDMLDAGILLNWQFKFINFVSTTHDHDIFNYICWWKNKPYVCMSYEAF